MKVKVKVTQKIIDTTRNQRGVTDGCAVHVAMQHADILALRVGVRSWTARQPEVPFLLSLKVLALPKRVAKWIDRNMSRAGKPFSFTLTVPDWAMKKGTK